MDMTPMSAFYRIIRILVPLAAATVLLSGCGSYRDIRIGDCRLETVSPSGFRTVALGLSVDVRNPAGEITVSGMSGTVYLKDVELGTFEAADVTVPGKSESDVDLSVKATLSGSFNFMQVMSMSSYITPDSLTADVSMKIKVKGGIGKKLDLKGVPLKNILTSVR